MRTRAPHPRHDESDDVPAAPGEPSERVLLTVRLLQSEFVEQPPAPPGAAPDGEAGPGADGG